MPTKTRVLIVGGEGLFAETLALALRLEPDLEILEPSSFSDVLERVTHQEVKVILQIEKDGERAVDLVQALRTNGCATVVVLISDSSRHLARKLMTQGVSSIFTTRAGIAALLETLRKSADDVNTQDPASSRHDHPVADQSTDPVRGVKTLLLEGLTNKEIGVRLGISEGAVKKHFQRIFRVLGARNRSEVVRVLIEQRYSMQRSKTAS